MAEAISGVPEKLFAHIRKKPWRLNLPEVHSASSDRAFHERRCHVTGDLALISVIDHAAMPVLKKW
jgi:hypothetical protein